MPQDTYDLRAFLKSHYYILGRKLGEGYFKEVYEVVHSKGPLKKRMVAKVNHEKPKESIQHKINLSKRNLHLRELEALNALQHPNVIQVYDLLEDEKRFVVIEEHFDAVSLEDKVRLQGPIRNHDFFQGIFSQAAEALRYLHVDRKMFHRDIKPSNILVGRQSDSVKLIDFQNAAFSDEIDAKILPTRGGTEYTHPDLLNSLLKCFADRASVASEFYALGATMFYTLTGTSPFDYRLVDSKNGRPLQIGDADHHVALLLGGTKLYGITADIHEKMLEEKLSMVPSSYREVLRDCLSIQDKTYGALSSAEAHAKFKKDFAAVQETALPKPFEAMLRENMPFLKEARFCEDQQAVSAVDKIVEAARQYGVRERKTDDDSSGFGSDAVRKMIITETYSLADERVKMEVFDRVFHYSYGTWSPGWEESYDRELKVSYNGETIILAQKRLERESGSAHEDFGKQGGLPWQVTKVGKLEEQVRKSQRIRSGCTLEVPKNGKFDIDYIKERGYRMNGASDRTIAYTFMGQEDEDKIVLEPEIG